MARAAACDERAASPRADEGVFFRVVLAPRLAGPPPLGQPQVYNLNHPDPLTRIPKHSYPLSAVLMARGVLRVPRTCSVFVVNGLRALQNVHSQARCLVVCPCLRELVRRFISREPVMRYTCLTETRRWPRRSQSPTYAVRTRCLSSLLALISSLCLN